MKPVRGISIMKQAISERQVAINRAGRLPTATIPDGQPLLRDLLRALRQSSTADRSFIGWMQDIADSGSCPISTATDSSYQAGYRASKRATTAKKQFVKMWNPLARKFGQPIYTSNGI